MLYSASVFPPRYHSAITALSFSSTCCYYQKDKWRSVANCKEKCCPRNWGELDRIVP